VAEFDQLADHYDATRGGQQRGDEYAADLDARLPQGDGPILEIGVGTGVVALGLTRRGRDVIGLDVSAPMLARRRPTWRPALAPSRGQGPALTELMVLVIVVLCAARGEANCDDY
jgi:SAM-dependent methyltransferase